MGGGLHITLGMPMSGKMVISHQRAIHLQFEGLLFLVSNNERSGEHFLERVRCSPHVCAPGELRNQTDNLHLLSNFL